MHKTLKTLLLALGILLANFAQAQVMSYTGRVTDADTGEPLPGVTVVIKETTNGTITNPDGYYTLKADKGSAIQFSYVGYLTVERILGDQADINIALTADLAELDEVVVIGYGQVKKKDLTGSVNTVSSADFNRGAITSPQDLLVGKSAGVVITSNSGAPGSDATIRIRGGSSLAASNDPLIVIDGVPIDNSSISGVNNLMGTINPNDIETFTILKDASATAIYGSRASNGVIIITTKRGKTGQPLRISYNGTMSASTIAKYTDILASDEYRVLAQENLGKHNITTAALERLGTENTDWQKEIYSAALSHDHNVSVSGSARNLPYRASVGYTGQQGILDNTDMSRVTATVGLDPSFFDNHLKMNLNAKGSYTRNNFGSTDAIWSAVEFDPTQPVMNGNTRYAGYTTWTGGGPEDEYNAMATSNPVARVNLTDNQADSYRVTANALIDYKLHWLPELRANLNLGIDAYTSEGTNNADTTAVWTRRAGFGQLTDYSQDGYNALLDFYLNYVKEIEQIDSKIDVMAGYSWQHFHRKGDNYQRSIEDENHPLIVANNTSFKTEYYLLSFFGRLMYTFKDRYLLTFTLRNDGSSRFDDPWSLFPSVALAWKINDEPFLKRVKEINELKLRLGWGKTGQQDISNNDYPYMGTYRASVEAAYYQFGDQWIQTLRPNAYDPDITWETTTTKNIGLDFGILNNRITGSVDYYERETEDLINTITIPNGSNFSNALTTNVGSLENKGYEITLDFKPVSTKDMSWNIGFNLSHNKNKITKLLRTDDPTYLGVQTGGISGGTGNNIQMNSVGYAVNSFFVLQQVYDTNGNPVEDAYVDRSGQGGTVSSNYYNFYHYKQPAADYLMGISSRFAYRNFDVSFSGRLSIGNYVYNNVAARGFYGDMHQNNFWKNLPVSINDTKFGNAQYFSDYYVENASFFKMDNIACGYNFDRLLTEKINGRVSFTVQNAFVITKYDGVDPEVASGIDNNIYPRPRMFVLGLNLNF